jgi:O-antigen/teichoic acid export membrane protein
MRLTSSLTRNSGRLRNFSFGTVLAMILVFCLIAFALIFSPAAFWRIPDSDPQYKLLPQMIDVIKPRLHQDFN